MAPTYNPNFPTGNTGLVAVDKVGNQILFLDPRTFATLAAIGGFEPRVHELAIAADRATAYAPIYGDGQHGANPNPGHQIAVIDLVRRRHVGSFDLAPYRAPHGIRWGKLGELYCVCENSSVVVQIDAASGSIQDVLDVGSTNAHRIEALPDGSKLYTENEEDAFASVLDLQRRKRLRDIRTPGGLAGLGLSPDGRTLILVSAERPELLVVDTTHDSIQRTVRLSGHATGAQVARFSPDGRWLVVTSHDEGIGTIMSADLAEQATLTLGRGPMDLAFAPDGRTAVVGNQDDGTLTVLDLETAAVTKTVQAGQGVEVLAYF